MHSFRYIAAVAALVVCSASPARAEAFISPFIGFNVGGDSANCATFRNCEDKRTNFGLSIGTRRGIFGFEGDVAYAPSFFGKSADGDNAVLTLMGSMMVVIPAGPVQPYGVLGVGLIRPHAKLDATSLTLDKSALGYDIGGGVNIFIGHGIGVRGDMRRMKTLKDVTLGRFSSDTLEFWRGSAGVIFRF